MMNHNWNRWIKASIAKAFEMVLSNNLALYIEGDDRHLSTKSDYCELRLNGPSSRQHGPVDWRLFVEVNVLITSIKDDDDAYKIHRNNGLVCAAFLPAITVYRYGDGLDDDQGIEGCLILRSDHHEMLMVNNFGQVENDLRVMQSTVEGHYMGDFIH